MRQLTTQRCVVWMPARKLRGMTSKKDQLRAALRAMGRVVIAYSGGVDSAFLLRVARDELGDNCSAMIGVSPSLLPEELDEARVLAHQIGAPMREVETLELEDPDYAANPNNRCYFCKSTLWQTLVPLVEAEKLGTLCDGTNTDDAREWRPGSQAGTENEIRSPLRDAGLSKADIRELSRELGLPTWDKPAMPCLSSRIPYGQSVTSEALHRIGRAEVFLRSKGLREVRVRHFLENDLPQARLEVAPAEIPLIFDFYEEAAAKLRELGFASVLLDLEGYRRGRLNEGTTPSSSPNWAPVQLML